MRFWIVATLICCVACSRGDEADLSSASGRTLSTIEIARKLAPAVVRLQVSAATSQESNNTFSGRGFGTGVIFDEQGHIVTNLHVLAQGSEEVPHRILTTLSDGRTFYATVVGTDEKMDLAVLKIDTEGLASAAFGDPGRLQVGEDVVAIGFAFDISGPPTVTRGVVSALRRKILQGELVIPDVIQTDASVHPGNSGGPLANSRGEVIGINTAVASWAPDVGFAVSTAILRPAAESIIRSGEVKRAYLGITTAEATVPIQLGKLTGKGIPVLMVLDGSPAYAAGLRAKDIIISIGGDQITTGSDLMPLLAKHKPGDQVVVEYYRSEQPQRITVTLGQLPTQ